MLTMLPTHAGGLSGDVNNFLKNEAEIVTDFRTRINVHAKETDHLQSSTQISYNRLISKMTGVECMAMLSDKTLFMEENY